MFCEDVHISKLCQLFYLIQDITIWVSYATKMLKKDVLLCYLLTGYQNPNRTRKDLNRAWTEIYKYMG